MDLSGSGLPNDAIGAPAWLGLPAEAGRALTSLITQSILDQAATTTTSTATRSVLISEEGLATSSRAKSILYVRQSSTHQVLHNRESSAFQYAMRDRLMAIGWSAVELIDDALGRSAAGGDLPDLSEW
ncbi:hypothetical protein ABIE89_000428 [Bradyrhizobium niftali]|uniref:hypothetical protein n=1 Tax=Bradyrhizobium niftali TaxID=2560055 RepID=UPI00383245B9